jgi:SAM-dependent methyltransferase
MGDPPVGTNYFIKPGYRPNEVRGPSVDTEYWNARRIERSGYFQYDTYRIARRVLRGMHAARLLDLGCGTGVKAAELLIPHCSYYCGLDQHSAVDYCRKTITAKHAEFRVEDLESPASRFDAPFDVIVCADVIEHLAHPERLLRYAAALLADGGRLIVSTPERDVMHGRDVLVSPNPEHVREWNRAELGAFMRACGLRVLDLRLAPQFRLAFTATGLNLLKNQLSNPRSYLGCQVALCARS